MMMTDKQWIKLMNAGEKLGCHQMPERSFFIKGYQFPVCARCTGVIISSILAILIFCKRRMPIKVCVAMSSVMLCDWGIQYLEIKESTNARRLITGLIGGLGYATLHLHFYRYVYVNIKELFKNTKCSV